MRYIDLTGQKFGKLTVIELQDHGANHKPAKWRCICECGNEKIVDSQLLRRGIITDCGCKIRNRLVGKRFGMLTVLESSDRRAASKSGGIYWKCKCDCGNIVYVSTNNLVSKYSHTVSCGCHRKSMATKHGKSDTRIYRAWLAIKERCINSKSKAYKYYGGRGISICNEWVGEHGFENFYDWSMNNGYAEDLTIDRIDTNGNYEPSNCRWVTQQVQMNNTRRNHYVEINGETRSLSDWARLYKIDIGTVWSRLARGWSDIDAITIPKIKHGYSKETYNSSTHDAD